MTKNLYSLLLVAVDGEHQVYAYSSRRPRRGQVRRIIREVYGKDRIESAFGCGDADMSFAIFNGTFWKGPDFWDIKEHSCYVKITNKGPISEYKLRQLEKSNVEKVVRL